MTDPAIDPLHVDLVFNGPLSTTRAERLIDSLRGLEGQHVVDLGCGWAELLLRILATEATWSGHGIDLDATAIEHARTNAHVRGLTDRILLEVGDAAQRTAGGVDVLVVNGSSHVWGGEPREHTANALTAARTLLRPGGRLLLGEGFWRHEPTQAQIDVMPNPVAQYKSLPGLIDVALEHGYRPLAVSEASRDEWDEFQSRFGLGWERWLLANHSSPHADHIRAKADAHRNVWLRGWRGTLGFAYLTLVLS